MQVAFMATPVEFGGAERVCLTLLKNINRERFDIVPILLTRPWEKDNLFVRQLKEAGYDCCEIPVALNETRDYLRVPRCYKILWRLLKGRDFDLLHTHGYFADIVGIPVARLNGVPTLSTCHGYIPTTWKLRIYNAVDRLVLRWSTQVLAVSEGIKRDLVDSGLSPSRISVVVNAVGSAEISGQTETGREALRKVSGICPADFVVGYVGRLSAEKGLQHLLAAVTELAGRGVPIRALIVGDGPLMNELQRLSRQMGLGDRVVFTGFQEDITHWLSSMDVFVLPSFIEGTPMALLEAMVNNVPVVASAVGGIPQVIKHGETGLLVSPGRSQEISEALLALHDDQQTRRMLARNAYALVKDRYGIAEWIGQIEAVYQSLSR